MEPAPYGGFMTRTAEEQNHLSQRLKAQQVPVIFSGREDTLRPEAVHVRGVDNLSTDQIESYVDMYLGPDDLGPDDRGRFRIQWIDDSSANVVFRTHEEAKAALSVLAESWQEVDSPEVAGAGEAPGSTPPPPFSAAYLENLLEERRAKSYAATLEFHKDRMKARAHPGGADLFQEKKAEAESQKEAEGLESMDEDGSSIVLYVRQSVQSDRKAKNAKEYSRYYLLHGEPDRSKPRGQRAGDRGRYSREGQRRDAPGRAATPEGGDLFAAKLEARSRPRRSRDKDDDDEDLFAWRLRERSPGRA